MDDLFSKLALQAVTTVGKAAFGMAVNKAVQRLKEYSESRSPDPSRNHASRRGSNTDSLDDGSAKGDQEQQELADSHAATAAEEMSDEIRAEFEQLDDLRSKLQQKIAILTPSIDMIQVVCAKSNNLGLHAVLNMASDLNYEMDDLSVLLNQVLSISSASPSSSFSSPSPAPATATSDRTPSETLALARAVTARVQRIMDKIEDSVPYINLALSISGVKLGQFTPAPSASSALLPGGGISLHTWFNASNLVAAAEPEPLGGEFGDEAAAGDWVPMTFACRVYRLFEASVRAEGLPNWTWKLEHLVSLVRVWRHRQHEVAESQSGPGETSQLVVEEVTPMPGEEPAVLAFPLTQLKAMFFTATGRLLNIPDANPGLPVLVVHLDEYVAIEIVSAQELYEEESDEDESDMDEEHSDQDDLPIPPRRSRKTTVPATPSRPAPATAPSHPPPSHHPWLHPPRPDPFPTSHHLALLESILRLVSLEHTLGVSHLVVPDDVLWAHLSSDQSPGIGSLAAAVPIPPAYAAPATPTSASPRGAEAAVSGSGSASARRRSRRSLTAAAAAAASCPVTPTAQTKQGGRQGGDGKRPKSRMAAIRDGEGSESRSSSPDQQQQQQRTPAPVRALNLMERFMSFEKDKDKDKDRDMEGGKS